MWITTKDNIRVNSNLIATIYVKEGERTKNGTDYSSCRYNVTLVVNGCAMIYNEHKTKKEADYEADHLCISFQTEKL